MSSIHSAAAFPESGSLDASSTDTEIRTAIQELETDLSQIRDVARRIQDIAGQTNLLALNATIEAARAGDAGRGFAVVAGEVKSLSSTTREATDQITDVVGAVERRIEVMKQALARRDSGEPAAVVDLRPAPTPVDATPIAPAPNATAPTSIQPAASIPTFPETEAPEPAGSTSLPLSPEQKNLIRESFAAVEPIADDAAALFYGRLFEIAPETKALFKGDMKSQGRKLMASLKTVIAGLDRAETILPVLSNLGVRHKDYGVEPRHYDAVGAALLWTLAQGLGDSFTTDAEEAWAGLYAIAANAMQHAAASA